MFSNKEPLTIRLARELLRLRISKDSNARQSGMTTSLVEDLSQLQISQTIEASICSIVESFSMMQRRGSSERAALLAIEHHRSKIGQGEMPEPLSLASYIHYRFKLEYSGPPLPRGHVDRCIYSAEYLFSELSKPDEITNAVTLGSLKEMEDERDFLMEQVYEAIVSPEANWDAVMYLELAAKEWHEEHQEIMSRRANFLLRAQLRDD